VFSETNQKEFTFKYTLETKRLDSMHSKDLPKYFRGFNGGRFDSDLRAYTQNTNRPRNPHKIPKSVGNLYFVIKNFIHDNCLRVINNFEGTDIYPTIIFPVILRHLEIALGISKYFNPNINRVFYKIQVI